MNRENGWMAWIYFAGVYMIMVGAFQMINGFVLLFRKTAIVVNEQSAIFASVSTYGWILLILGLILLLTGIGVLSGKTWARMVGIVFAVLAAIVNFAFIPVYPLWSIIALVIDTVVVYALATPPSGPTARTA